MSHFRSGFTLIELLVVISILAILAVVVYESLDPLKQFAEARNARRWSQVNSLSTATYRYVIEKGQFPPGIDDKIRQLGTAVSGCGSACPGAEETCLDLNSISDYMPVMPKNSKVAPLPQQDIQSAKMRRIMSSPSLPASPKTTRIYSS